MTDKEAKDYILECDVAPDDIVVNGKWWKIETTYLSRREALDSAEFLDHYKLFKYKNGYVLYERNYDVPDESQAVKTSTFSGPKRYNMYCPHCREWIMAKQGVGEWHKTPFGASRFVYTCPSCQKSVTPSWETPPIAEYRESLRRNLDDNYYGREE